MLVIVALNGEKIPPVWFERGYRLTSTVYKEVFETKVLPWVKKITSMNLPTERSAGIHGKDSAGRLDTDMSF